jgi:hypothetical protein
MTHHNQTKELTTWFLNPPLMSPMTTKGTKLEVRIEDPMKHSRKTKKPRKAQEGHLEEEKTTMPTKGTKNGKPRKRAKKRSK